MTLSRRDTLRQLVMSRLGLTIATTSATSTTALTFATLQHRWSDDSKLKDEPIFLPSLAAADQHRTITNWDDSAGIATIDVLSTDPDEAIVAEIYRRGDPKREEIDEAINEALKDLRRVVWNALPTIEGEHHYTLAGFPWVRNKDDIIGVFHRLSPNLVDNEDFEMWGDGETSALPSWALSGSGAVATRATTAAFRRGYGVTLTAAGGNAAVLTQIIGLLNQQLARPASDGVDAVAKTITVSVIGLTSVASAAKLTLNDGVTATDSSDHTGDGIPKPLTVTKTLSSDATTLEAKISMNVNGDASFDHILIVEGTTIPDWLRDHGSVLQDKERIIADRIDRAVAPYIVTRDSYSREQQLVVATKQPFYELSADGDVTDAPENAILAGALVKLAEQDRRGEAKDRMDRIAQRWLPRWLGWQQRLAQQFVPNARKHQARVRGA